jgi:hypothetical protein
LPELPANKAGIYARDGLDPDLHAPLLRMLTNLLVPHALSESPAAAPAGKGLAGKELAGKELAGKELAGKELAPAPRVRTHELHRAR